MELKEQHWAAHWLCGCIHTAGKSGPNLTLLAICTPYQILFLTVWRAEIWLFQIRPRPQCCPRSDTSASFAMRSQNEGSYRVSYNFYGTETLRCQNSALGEAGPGKIRRKQWTRVKSRLLLRQLVASGPYTVHTGVWWRSHLNYNVNIN